MKKMYLLLAISLLFGIGYASSITRGDTKITPEQLKATAITHFATKSMAVENGFVIPNNVTPNEQRSILNVSDGKTALGSSLETPYTGLNSAADFLLWNVIDVNEDGKTWVWNSYNNVANYDYSGTNSGNDWLISPAIKLTSGKSYRLTYYINGSGSSYPEKLEVRIGKGSTVEDQTTSLATYNQIVNYDPALQTVIHTSTEDADFNIGFYAFSDPDMYNLQVKNFKIEEIEPNDLMALSIVGDEKFPVGIEKDYTITIKNNGFETQNNYSVRLVKEDGTILATKDLTTDIASNEVLECVIPYTAITAEDVEIFGEVVLDGDLSNTNDRTPTGISVSFSNGQNVKGKVIDPLGTDVEDAVVNISGIFSYEAKTSADGTFTISSVLANESYTLSISKPNFTTYTSTFDVVETDVDLGTLQLEDITVTPQDVVAVDNDSHVSITWKEQSLTEIYRYDDGIAKYDIGVNKPDATEKSLFGSVYRTPTTLKSMSWWTTINGGPHTTVSIRVFDLNGSGEPTSTVLFSKIDHPNVDDQWNKYEFEVPVDCPRGFMVAVSSNGYVGLGCDSGTSEEWPFMPNCNYYTMDYTSGQFNAFGLERPFNFLIRAEGTPSSKGGEIVQFGYTNKSALSGSEIQPVVDAGYPETNLSEAKSFTGYKVYRFMQENEANQEAWTELTGTPITSLNYDDNTWATAPNGAYKYAVKAIYSNDIVSSPGISNVIEKISDYAVITINVNTNTPSNEANGAVVVIKNKDGNIEHVYNGIVSNGKAVINDVSKGVYDISITLDGFNMVEKTDLDWSDNDTYEVGPYILNEIIIDPFNLKITETDIATQRIFSWNGSNDALAFLVDGIFVGTNESKAFINYEVYLDGVKAGETTNATTYTFNNLTAGDHVAGVKAVYSSTTTDLQTINFNVTIPVNKYKVTYNTPANGTLKVLNGGVNVVSGTLIEEGTELTIEAAPNAGYEVKTLTANSVNIIDNKVTVGAAAVEIFAEFALKQYAVTIVQAPNGVITINRGATTINSGDKVDHGTEITIVTTPDKDYILDHITINGNKLEEGIDKYKVIEDITVTAVFRYYNGVIDVNSTINLSLHPNPVKNILNINGEYQSLEIYDVNGRLVLTANGEATVDVSSLTQGTYIIKAKNNDKVGTYKIVK